MLTMMALTFPVHAAPPAAAPAEDVREIERGLYVKANVGTQTLFATHGEGPLFGANVGTSVAVGVDIIDEERGSVAIEGQFDQTLFYGPDRFSVADQSLSQGHLLGVAGSLVLEASTYPSRRLGVGLRAGVGIAQFPLLADEDTFLDQIAPRLPLLHRNGTWLQLVGGPTVEYYTKLAHFSLGADMDFIYILGFDVGFRPTGYMKYTF